MLDGWKLLAGLGIFLFGMFMMEESIKLLAGRSFKTLIRRFTGTRLKSLISGLLSTAILQSSSAVSLIVLAFVGAGMLTLVNAVSVIMGTMIGTTVTAWFVAIFGFKFKIDALALPLIGIGGLGLIVLARSPKYINISKLLAAFGFLFLGLDYMKAGVANLSTAIDLTALPGFGPWIYLIAGVVLTAIMQSSSATIAVILTTLHAGVIDLDQAAAMVIGANVGTTVTILLGAIGGVPVKKQVAFSSLAFNLGAAAITLPALPFILWVVTDLLNFADNPVMAIAAFHTLFNVMGVLVFWPLAPQLTRLLRHLFPDRKSDYTRFIHNTTPEVPEAAIAALRKEVLHQAFVSMRYIIAAYKLHPKSRDANPDESISKHAPTYEDIERLHAGIFSFYAQMQSQAIDPQEAMQLEPVIRASRSIMNATKNLHEMQDELAEIGGDDNPFMVKAHHDFRDRLLQLWAIAQRGAMPEDNGTLADDLDQLFQATEEADRQFIRSCSNAVVDRTIKEREVTLLLMSNRAFTQSTRMIILSMQELVRPRTLSSQ